MKRKILFYTLAITAFVVCPCGLPLTLPLLTVLLGSTSWSVFVTQNTTLFYGLSGAYFVFGLLAVIWMLSKRGKAKGAECETCQEPGLDRRQQG